MNFLDKFYNFYTTERSSIGMSDGGGPFGFDIHFALEMDYLIKKHNVDCIIETGTNAGDTTEYLCRSYPDIEIISCEVNKDYFDRATKRLWDYKNVTLYNKSSQEVVYDMDDRYDNPIYYLDAHWGEYWPLEDEIENISKGVVCVSDFYNPYKQIIRQNVEYGFDSYNGQDCDIRMLRSLLGTDTKIYTNNILDLDVYEFPCLQNVRRSGRAYFTKDLKQDHFVNSNYFVKVPDHSLLFKPFN